MATEAQKVSNARYKKENMIQMQFRVNKKTDPDLVELLDGMSNRQGYIKALIRADMESDTPLYKQYQ